MSRPATRRRLIDAPRQVAGPASRPEAVAAPRADEPAPFRARGRGGASRGPLALARIRDTMLVQFLRAPTFMGGIVPSSSLLALAMSRQAAGFDAVVELGAGTGAVTRRLVADHPRVALTVIEREPRLARLLARRYSHARVHDGCVHDCVECLLAQPPRTVAVSSLPFRSLPDDVAYATAGLLERFLLAHPSRRLVQYSYGLRHPFAFRDPRLAWRRVERVWRNVPPAIVWVAAVAKTAG
jgi:phospholipid N-methyltransferase